MNVVDSNPVFGSPAGEVDAAGFDSVFETPRIEVKLPDELIMLPLIFVIVFVSVVGLVEDEEVRDEEG